jgi:hypothetical protein
VTIMAVDRFTASNFNPPRMVQPFVANAYL